MTDFRNRVLVGNIVIFPNVVRECLAKSYYFLIYVLEEESLTLSVNDGSGGKVLFEIRNVPYESAVKLAEGLGLKGDGASPLSWGKWNPTLRLYHDGSEKAELLRTEMLKLGIPHRIFWGSYPLALTSGQGKMSSPAWTPEQMMEEIRNVAKRYKELLETTP